MTDEQATKAADMRRKYPELFEGMPDVDAVKTVDAPPSVDPTPIAKSVENALPVAALVSEIHSAVEAQFAVEAQLATHGALPVAAHGALPVVDNGQTVTPLGQVGQPTAPVDAIPAGSGPGFVVFWSVQGGQNRTAIETALANVDFRIFSNFPDAPSPVAALQRAKTSTAGKVLGVVMRSTGKGQVALVSEKTGGASDKVGKLNYNHGVTVSVPTGTSTSLQVDSFDESALDCLSAANELATAYRDHMTRVEAADMSAWLTACIDDLGAVSLRPRGGVYFIPASKGAQLAQLKAAADATGAAQLYTMALDSDETTAGAVAGATAESFLGEFKAIERDVSDWTSGLVDAKRPGRGFNALGSQLKTLKDRVFMYREVLKAQESNLSAVIEGASSALKDTFDKYTSAKDSLTVESNVD